MLWRFAALKEYLIEEYNALQIEPYEADDIVVAIHDRYGEDSVLIGIDKDNLQSPGWHYNYDKDELFQVSREEADYNFAAQMIIGDSGDNIPGIPGLGAKAVGKKLKEGTPLIKQVFDLYMARELSVDYFTEQYRLLRMHKDIYYPYELFFTQLPEVNEQVLAIFDNV